MVGSSDGRCMALYPAIDHHVSDATNEVSVDRVVDPWVGVAGLVKSATLKEQSNVWILFKP